MFVGEDGIVIDEYCDGCCFRVNGGCQKPSYISKCPKERNNDNEQ